MDVEKIVRDNIDSTVHLSLATVSDNTPWICEVHFAYDDGLNLYFRSLKSRRHSQEIANNPKVAGNIIDNYPAGAPVVGLYFEGVAELLGPGVDQANAAQSLKDRLSIEDDLIEEAKSEVGHQLYKITVKNWYAFGRFGGDSGQKLKLEWNK